MRTEKPLPAFPTSGDRSLHHGVVGKVLGMAWSNPWQAEGHWYRGNLHTHTQASDGASAPADAIERYRAAGYNFLSITDHHRFTNVSGFADDRFAVINGIEFGAGRNEVGEPYHIVGIGITAGVNLEPGASPAETIAAIRQKGGEAILAHPYWSGHTVAGLMELGGLLGVEVYNETCQWHAKGLSQVHWDDALIRGKRWFGFASDDCHAEHDFAGGWIVARSKSLQPQAIMESLRAGHFYASQGPRIVNLEFDHRTVSVRCSPAIQINFVCNTWRGRMFRSRSGGLISQASLELPEGITYVRVECIDGAGKMAWSNPVFLE